jgi:hypothetical protein
VNGAALIEQLRRLPDDARTYGCDEHFAQLHFGFDATMLHELADAGLPAVAGDDGMRFEYGDLHYVGLRLGTASTYLWTVRGWASALTRFAERARTQVTIAYVPQLAANGAAPVGTVRLPDGTERRVVVENGCSVAEARVVLRGTWPRLPPAAARIVRELAGSIVFCMLPPALQGDVELVRRTGLSDCMTASLLIVDAWRAAGIEARISGGLLVSTPYSTTHGWPEVRIRETWVPVDPLMVQTMCDFGGLDAARWPPERSVGAMLLPLDEPERPLLVAGDAAVEVSLMTSVDDPAAG